MSSKWFSVLVNGLVRFHSYGVCVRLGVGGLDVGRVVLEVDSLKNIEPSWLYRKNVVPACIMVSLWL